ncbi:transmembrane protein 221 [Ictalurus punctatus]|uniref:Transmembrane protein 221 n=1 Tax=Ictalurus punctatus TaxID=7998 RepID=A0A2D0RUP5_ICTPU|nr:transmembrane protein 221 [Ictalurus punctatus]
MSYSQRALLVLALLGVLSAIMSLMSVSLIFQLNSVVKESGSAVPEEMWAVLKPLSSVLSALSLTLNSSAAIICLLHAHFTTEMWREHTHRAEWFLSDSRVIRHVAIGLFCAGISFYLGALSIYMLLVFEIETGIASVCVLSSGVLVLLVLVAHTLVRAACTSKHFLNQHINTMYQNDPESSAGICTVSSELSLREKTTRQRSEDSMNHLFSYTEPKQQHSNEREVYGGSGRMHRTTSTESSLLQTHTKPWNGVNHEMRTVLTRKATGKDSTLV